MAECGWIINELPRWILVILWLGANVIIFVYNYLYYCSSKEYYYLRLFVGNALCWARGSAACLRFNCMLILLPVCRNLISYLRGSCTCCRRNIRRQLDKNLTFHKYIAYMICIQTAIHTGAHVFDFEHLASDVIGVKSALNNLQNNSVNPISSVPADPTKEVFKTLSGISGVIITLCLIVMVSSSTDFIRRSYFEVFWVTHHVFTVFFIGLIVHGMQQIIRAQSNVDKHDPEQCVDKEWGKEKCPIPTFSGSPPQAWMLVIAPLVLYFLERCLRLYRSFQKVIITKVVKHPSSVYELQLQKKGFKMSSGQYIFVKCPSISHFEWHPFTLTSAPEDEYFSIHIRRVGDWTNALAQKCHDEDGQYKEAWNLPKISVDGPFGTATEDIFRYQVDVIVAAGIGVTPYASVLKHIRYKLKESNFEMKLKKVYFYWICPNTSSFEWIQDLLQTFEAELQEHGQADFLDYNIFLTRGWDPSQAKNIILNDEETADAVTGLRKKTQFGRPKWDQVISSIERAHVGVSIGVFFCGPSELSKILHKTCNRYSSSDPQGTHFFYNKESF